MFGLLGGGRDGIVISSPGALGILGLECLAKSEQVFKVSTDATVHEAEMRISKRLLELDPDQKYFVFPVAAYTVPVKDAGVFETLNDASTHRPLRPDSKQLHVRSLRWGGQPLSSLSLDLTAAQAKLAIYNLLQGLITLHCREIAHGDVHDGNVVIHIDSRGSAAARWIDFSRVKCGEASSGKGGIPRDAENFSAIVCAKILSRVPSSEEDDGIHELKSIARYPPIAMDAMGIMRYVAANTDVCAVAARL